MAIWSVSRVCSPHASVRTRPGYDYRRRYRVETLDNAYHGMSAPAEPGLAVGLRLFWATILAMTLVLVIPLTAGWALRPVPHAAPVAMSRPVIAPDPIAVAIPVAPKGLPEAQRPPQELLLNSQGPLALTEGN
jgi:hypothetical protein